MMKARNLRAWLRWLLYLIQASSTITMYVIGLRFFAMVGRLSH